jgi:hypothetical protein
MTGTPAEVRASELVRDAYLGKAAVAVARRRPSRPAVGAEVADASRENRRPLGDLSPSHAKCLRHPWGWPACTPSPQFVRPGFGRILRSSRTQDQIHGDPQLGRFYRTSRRDMGLLDWQSCGVGGWLFDVAYTLATALPGSRATQARARSHRLLPRSARGCMPTSTRSPTTPPSRPVTSEIPAGAYGKNAPGPPIILDPPEDPRFRRLLQPAFGPSVVAGLEAGTRAQARQLIEWFKGRWNL